MKPDLREDFDNGHLEVGELIDVEVMQVQPERRRVVLRDVGEADVPALPEGPPAAA